MKIPNPPSPPFNKRGDFKVIIYPAPTNRLSSGNEVSIQATVLNRHVDDSNGVSLQLEQVLKSLRFLAACDILSYSGR